MLHSKSGFHAGPILHYLSTCLLTIVLECLPAYRYVCHLFLLSFHAVFYLLPRNIMNYNIIHGYIIILWIMNRYCYL